MLKILFTYVCVIVFPYSALGQHSLGVEGGFASSNKASFSNFYQYGLRYEIKYPIEKASISIQESYEYKNKINNNSINYAKTMFGFDFNFGKKLYYVIGGGLSIKLLLTNKSYYNDSQKIIIGGKFNTGLGYNISQNILISVLYQYHFDITPAANFKQSQHNGQIINDYIREKIPFIQLSIQFTINKKL